MRSYLLLFLFWQGCWHTQKLDSIAALPKAHFQLMLHPLFFELLTLQVEQILQTARKRSTLRTRQNQKTLILNYDIVIRSMSSAAFFLNYRRRLKMTTEAQTLWKQIFTISLNSWNTTFGRALASLFFSD